MKVHPAPKKRNITFRYDINSSLSEANRIMGRQKKLRRLPHIFSRVLELPFHSDTDVVVEENSESFRFAVVTDDVGQDVRAHTIEIYPGVTKIVIRGSNFLELSLDELELDLWRYRLPPTTRPELASAVYVDGELIVTIPKGVNSENLDDRNDEEVWGEGNGDFGGEMGRLVLVQPQPMDDVLEREALLLMSIAPGLVPENQFCIYQKLHSSEYAIWDQMNPSRPSLLPEPYVLYENLLNN
ncbi:hypothetical protein HHK36_020600 [Tetracentron sinense]|uniref:SHSP domain-containing protein n=1 Tax=Tetracentron sinense TaxID=13715 RepID=A0A834YU90_TETSI|nr:hypothetical protein HHK36_020600 [Tetracentron sinense]